MRPFVVQDRSDRPPLAHLAFAQHGVAGWRQLRADGITEGQIRGLVRRGHLIRLYRGVYAVGHVRLSARGRWMAAILACGEGARLSHRDALALHGLRRIGGREIHVTAPRVHALGGVRCHRTRDVDRLGAAVIDGIPVTGLERTLLDEAVTLSHQRLRALLEEVERRDRFDLRRLTAELEISNGHRGVGRLRAALAEMSETPPALRSDLEQAFLMLVRDAGLPEPSVNVLVAGELFDFHWPERRVIVEIDSWRYHRSRRSFEDDRRRANAAALADETLLRITDARIDGEPAAVMSEVAAALG